MPFFNIDERVGFDQEEDLSTMPSVNDLMLVKSATDDLTSEEVDPREQTKMNLDSYRLPEEYVKIKITEYSDPFEIIDDCSSATYMDCISDLAWVRLGEDFYALSLTSFGTIRVRKDNDGMSRKIYVDDNIVEGI